MHNFRNNHYNNQKIQDQAKVLAEDWEAYEFDSIYDEKIKPVN